MPIPHTETGFGYGDIHRSTGGACFARYPVNLQEPDGTALEPEPATDLSSLPVADLVNLSPWQSWVHLYCREEERTCRVTFECNGMKGEPVTWTVDVEPKTIFSYWPNKTADDGSSADLQAALMDAGKTQQ